MPARPDQPASAALIDALADSIAVLDGDGAIVLVNAAWKRLGGENGVPLAQASVGVNYVDVCKEAAAAGSDDAATILAALEKLLSGETAEFQHEYGLELATGKSWYRLRAALLGDADRGVVVSHSDITAPRLAERRFREAIETRNRFLSLASHELRTPLTSVKGYASVLSRTLKREGNAELLEMAEYIVEDADRMNRMISEILDASRIEHGKLEIKQEPVDLIEVVTESIAEVGNGRDDFEVQLAAPNEVLLVLGDRRRLLGVLANLLGNSARYARGEKSVKVSVARRGDVVNVSVEDNGAGLPEHLLPHVFDLFFGAGEHSGPKSRGLGLGLYIGKAVVEAHGGSIGVESEPGKTTTFTVSLPLIVEGPSADQRRTAGQAR